jgi:uncharacterized protein
MELPAFQIIAKPVGPACNLDCKYCFYLEKEALYAQGPQGSMSDQLLDSFVRQYIESQPTDTVHFSWQGGEPTLLGVEFFRKAVSLQMKYAAGKRIENSFQTNGVLLNDGWGQFLAENRFLVGVSIDGPRELHDEYRRDKAGNSTFDRVMRGVEVLKRFGIEFNCLATVHRKNSLHPLEVYRFLRDHGSGYIQFIPIVERASSLPASNGLNLVSPESEAPATVTEWSVEPEAYGRFLCTIFDEWVRKDVGKQFVQLFDVSLEMWIGMEASLCVFRKTCGSAMVMEYCGDVYSCDHFVYPENRLGNLSDELLSQLASSPQQIKFGRDKEDKLPQACRECDVLFACNGECPKHRFVTSAARDAGLNYLCAAYKMFFRHINPYMRFMAEELGNRRPPANIMSLIAAQQKMIRNQFAAPGKTPRNTACPCGSGKKYKKCCGAS